MIYKYRKSEPRWINFENKTGEKGAGGMENNGAKGHAFEHFENGEEKELCCFSGSGIVRRIWLTVSDRSPEALQGIIIKMFCDGAEAPQVECPLGDFFCMGLGIMKPFENCFFSTAEGRSFCCFIPMPFKKSCRITLYNATGKYINNLFYDINITLEPIDSDDMYFYALFQDINPNELEKEVEILPKTVGTGRFLGASVSILPDEKQYGDIWWGEGEVKVYLDGDRDYPTLAGTGTEDYIGSAWELGEFINRTQGCTCKNGLQASFYRFHIDDEINFSDDIRVTLQAMGGGDADNVRKAEESGAACTIVSYDDGELHGVYKTDITDYKGYTNFYRQDRYRTVAYFYKK